MKKIVSLFVLLICFSVQGEVNYCVPHLPKTLDPHKLLDPVEEKIVKKVLKSLIPKEGIDGLAKDWKQIEKNSWRVTLKAGIKFNKTLGWKGLGDIGAKDVKFSIERQIKSDNKNLTYLPATQNLSQKIKSINVISFREVDFIFKAPMDRAEFEKIFSSQIGWIISEEFHAYKMKKELKNDYFATTGEYTINYADSRLIRLTPVVSKNGANDIFQYKYLDPFDATALALKEKKCQYVFNPPLSLRKSIELSKVKTAKLPVSSTRWFLILKNDTGLERNDLLLMHRKIGPDNLKELNGVSKIYNLMGPNKWDWPYIEKVEAKPDTELSISTCRSNLHYSINQSSLLSEIKTKFAESTGVIVDFSETPCEQMYSFLSDIDSSGTVMPVTYVKEEEVLTMMGCNDSSMLFCLTPTSPDLKGIDESAKIYQSIFPLFAQENYFLRVF